MTHSRKRSNIVPLTADPRAANALKYREEYCELIKTMAREGQFPEVWCAKMGVSMSTMYNWATRYPEFDLACRVAWTALSAFWTRTTVDVALGRNVNVNVKVLLELLRRRFPDTWGGNPRNTEQHFTAAVDASETNVSSRPKEETTTMSAEQLRAELDMLRRREEIDREESPTVKSKVKST